MAATAEHEQVRCGDFVGPLQPRRRRRWTPWARLQRRRRRRRTSCACYTATTEAEEKADAMALLRSWAFLRMVHQPCRRQSSLASRVLSFSTSAPPVVIWMGNWRPAVSLSNTN
uniref:Uncharacterized protein n=1 Tax=Triticum urartu TaxID=4572 RepID=A0A8R7V6L3_TRIUA